MRIIVRIIAAIMVLCITTSFTGYMMDLGFTRYAIPVNIAVFVMLLASALYNNYLENKKFRQFLLKAKQDQVLQNETSRPSAEKPTMRPGEYTHYKTRKTGLSWTAGTVHGAVPKRGEKRTFLSRR
jgi:hypothetical protein